MFSRDNTVFSSTDRTAAPTAAVIDTRRAIGMHLIINVTSNASTVSATPTISALTTFAGSTSDYYTLFTGSAITSTGNTVVKLGPHLTTGTNKQNDYLPQTIKIGIAHSSTESIQYSAGVKKFYQSDF